MTTIRRLYAYLLTLAGLSMLGLGLANLAQVLIDVLFQASAASNPQYVRDAVSRDVAAALVGLPVWLLHFLWTERSARNDERERASTLRRLFFYLVLAAAIAITAVAANEVLFNAIVWRPIASVRALPFVVVALLVWGAHWRIASRDRALVGEVGGSATLRRWYSYGIALAGWCIVLSGASGLLETLWHVAVGPSAGSPTTTLAATIATTLIGGALWVGHASVLPRWLPQTVQPDDGRSTLRSVYLFLALSVGVVGLLFGVSQLLFYAVGRLLGVAQPGGVGGDLLQAAAGPTSVALVYGAGWAYQRYALRVQAAAVAEAPRQAGIRRLYTYTVGLIALAVLGIGLAGLLWTLGDIVLAVPGMVADDAWRSNIAQFATQALVGLPVWARHWKPRVAGEDEVNSLARRLAIYLSLIGAMLSLVGSLAFVLYRLISLLLGAGSTVDVRSDLAHALAVAVVAGTIAAYHWRILRREPQRAPAPAPAAIEAAPEAGAPVQALVQIRAADAAALERALSQLRAAGLEVAVVGT